jgi:hypothetical protein
MNGCFLIKKVWFLKGIEKTGHLLDSGSLKVLMLSLILAK